MHLDFRKFALACAAAAVSLSTAVSAAQKIPEASPIPPATPQANTSQPATHFTQGTITSIETDRLVLTRKVRGKSAEITFALNSQTQRSGNLIRGARVSVQYREVDHQNIAAAVREMAVQAAAKPGKS